MLTRNTVHVRVRIDFDSGASIGPGKITLLERIETSGSLSQAARDLGLSYRRAWNLVDDLNHAFAAAVVATATGGVRGGGAQITSFGKQLIVRYRRIEQAAEAAANRQFKVLAKPSRSAARPAAGSIRKPLARPLKKA